MVKFELPKLASRVRFEVVVVIRVGEIGGELAEALSNVSEQCREIGMGDIGKKHIFLRKVVSQVARLATPEQYAIQG